MAGGALDFPKNVGYSISASGRPTRRKETGTAFDATIMDELAPVGSHERASDDKLDAAAFSSLTRKTTKKRTTFLKKGSGMGGTLKKSEEAEEEEKKEGAARPAPRVRTTKQRATSKRSNPPNTDFRRFYERGDLPIFVEHMPAGIRVKWELEESVASLNYNLYLPIFMSGLRETEEPYQSLALHGTLDMIEDAPSKVRKVVPQLAAPIHTALTTRDPTILRRVLLVLQTMVKSGAEYGVGEALVPYFRNILPILNIFKDHNEDLGDGIAYGQRKKECLGDLISETLELFEIYGGELAFVNIKYYIPTYESCLTEDADTRAAH